MHVYDGHPGAIVAEVNVVGDEPWHVRIDEVDQLFAGRLHLFERSLTNLRSIDVHDRVRHIRPPALAHLVVLVLSFSP